MSNVNDVQSPLSEANTVVALDRRRAGRRAYTNPHLIGLMRAQDRIGFPGPGEEQTEEVEEPQTRPFLALTVACCVFWGIVAFLVVNL